MSKDILNSILLGTELPAFPGGPQAYPSVLPPAQATISEPFLTPLFLSYNTFISNSSWLETDLESNHFSSPPLSLSRHKLTSLLNYCKSLTGIPTSTLPDPHPLQFTVNTATRVIFQNISQIMTLLYSKSSSSSLFNSEFEAKTSPWLRKPCMISPPPSPPWLWLPKLSVLTAPALFTNPVYCPRSLYWRLPETLLHHTCMLPQTSPCWLKCHLKMRPDLTTVFKKINSHRRHIIIPNSPYFTLFFLFSRALFTL